MKSLFVALCLSVAGWAADLASFNGVWEVATAEMDGSPVDAAAIGNLVLTLKDGTYRLEVGDTKARGTFTVDFSQNPPTMDVTEIEGPSGGRTLRAITELTADGWRAVYAMQGDARPKAFKTQSGDGAFLANYRRKADRKSVV